MSSGNLPLDFLPENKPTIKPVKLVLSDLLFNYIPIYSSPITFRVILPQLHSDLLSHNYIPICSFTITFRSTLSQLHSDLLLNNCISIYSSIKSALFSH